MPLDSDRLELAILNTGAQSKDGRAVSYHYGDLTNHMRQVDQEAADEPINVVIDAVVSLAARNQLILEKLVGTQRSAFDFTKYTEERYLNEFFAAIPSK